MALLRSRRPNRIAVQPEPGSVASRNAAEEADPAAVGSTVHAIEHIWSAVEALYASGVHPAIQLCIRRRGAVVLDRAIGHARGNSPGDDPDGRKVRSTIHWVSAQHAIDAEVRLYERLYTVANPLAHKEMDFKDFINPDSLKIITAKLEPMLADVDPGTRFQFERVGYFCADKDHKPEKPVFNRTLTLRAPRKD